VLRSSPPFIMIGRRKYRRRKALHQWALDREQQAA